MTQLEIAKAMNIKPQALSSYLKGKRNVGSKMALRVASFLGCPSEWQRFVRMPGSQLRALPIRSES